METRPLIVLIFLLSSLSGCSDSSAATTGKGGTRGKIADSSGGTVALGLDSKATYRPTALSVTGSVGGTVSLQGASADRIVAVSRDNRVCGDSASVTETQANGNSLANVLVWIDGLTAGKSLPEVRRETLTIERCRLSPRVLAVPAGTTVNVFSRDGATHTWRFYREGVDEPIDEIWTVDNGQVVPSEKIAKQPGIVEARDAQQPWARGYVAVFDHPYFAVTDDNGAFTIDSLPPGTYTVKVWHERMAQPMEQRVAIAPGGTGRLELAVSLR
jgi:hypothetical protein